MSNSRDEDVLCFPGVWQSLSQMCPTVDESSSKATTLIAAESYVKELKNENERLTNAYKWWLGKKQDIEMATVYQRKEIDILVKQKKAMKAKLFELGCLEFEDE